MFDSGKSNPSCEFKNELVSYLYGELTDQDKSSFELHLGECNSCPAELSAFAAIGNSVREWRDSEFVPMPTPAMQVVTASAAHVETEADLSIIERIKLIFVSPAFLKTAGAFGTLLVLALFGWMIIGNQESEMAGAEKVPTEVQQNRTQEDEVVVTQDEEPADEKILEPAQKLEPVKISQPERSVIKKPKRIVRRPVKKKQPVKQPPVVAEPVIRLTEEFAIDASKDEDDLRLSDLLDDVGSKDK